MKVNFKVRIYDSSRRKELVGNVDKICRVR
jgi:hypothetical protein